MSNLHDESNNYSGEIVVMGFAQVVLLIITALNQVHEQEKCWTVGIPVHTYVAVYCEYVQVVRQLFIVLRRSFLRGEVHVDEVRWFKKNCDLRMPTRVSSLKIKLRPALPTGSTKSVTSCGRTFERRVQSPQTQLAELGVVLLHAPLPHHDGCN
jgi:hypothetical protein